MQQGSDVSHDGSRHTTSHFEAPEERVAKASGNFLIRGSTAFALLDLLYHRLDLLLLLPNRH